MTPPLLVADEVTKHFPVTRGLFGKVVGQVRAVDGVSFEVAPGETLGLVGESGCGKTTIGRCLLRLTDPTSGRILFDGADVTHASRDDLRKLRKQMQVVFQDPYSSLNPRLRVIDIVGEALEVHGLAKGEEVERRVARILERVGLSRSWINRYPHEFSGGQRQRIGIARAIALEPKLIVCDEAVSALDVSIQAQVLNLLVELRREMGLSYVFIAHDLSVVRHVSHRIAVMYLGQVVEMAPTARLFDAPSHPYTRALLSAIPVPDPRHRKHRLVLHGDVPSPLNPPRGCRFHTRCPAVMDRCREEEPPSYAVEDGHPVKCFHAEGLEGHAAFFEEVSRRIEARTAENAKVAATAAVDPSAVAEAAAVAAAEAAREAAAVAAARQRAAEREARARSAKEDGTRRRAILGTVLLALVLATVFGVRASRKREAVRQLNALAHELDERARITGSYPEELEDLGWRLHAIFDRGAPVDPWGKRIRYRVPGSGGHEFELESTGPDGVTSGDDLRAGR